MNKNLDYHWYSSFWPRLSNFYNSTDDPPDQTVNRENKNRMSFPPPIDHKPPGLPLTMTNWHDVRFADKGTTSNGDCNSDVKCGPRMSKNLRLKKWHDFEEDDVEMTVQSGESSGSDTGEASGVDEDPFVKQMNLTSCHDETESQQHKELVTNHRLSINCRSGSKKSQFLISRMTSSVRNVSFSIGVTVSQDTFMSTKRTPVWCR